MKLSKRLKKVAEMVTTGNTIADVGTDHAFLPIALIEEGKCSRAVAMDIASGPIRRAQEHVNESGLATAIECRLSDGFEKLSPDEVDTVVIAGMGGDLICNILEKKKRIAKELIVSPHTHQEIVRRELLKQGYRITDEAMIIDAGKYYVVIKAERCGDATKEAEAFHDGDNEGAFEKLTPAEEYFGKILIERKDEILKSFLLKELDKFHDIPQKSEYVELIKSVLW